MTNYVCGFAFDREHHNVLVLIEKNKPEWQKGKLNGIGGKIEDGETPHAAMVRECREETGLEIPEWKQFARYTGDWGTVHFFTSNTANVFQAQMLESEQIIILSIETALSMPHIPNLRWLIPMAHGLHTDPTCFEIRDVEPDAS